MRIRGRYKSQTICEVVFVSLIQLKLLTSGCQEIKYCVACEKHLARPL